MELFDYKKYKVGDKLCYDSSCGLPRVITIKKITPKGTIVDEDGIRYRDGVHYAGDMGSMRSLREIIQKDSYAFKIAKLYRFISEYDFKKCSLEDLEYLEKAIKEGFSL